MNISKKISIYLSMCFLVLLILLSSTYWVMSVTQILEQEIAKTSYFGWFPDYLIQLSLFIVSLLALGTCFFKLKKFNLGFIILHLFTLFMIILTAFEPGGAENALWILGSSLHYGLAFFYIVPISLIAIILQLRLLAIETHIDHHFLMPAIVVVSISLTILFFNLLSNIYLEANDLYYLLLNLLHFCFPLVLIIGITAISIHVDHKNKKAFSITDAAHQDIKT